MVRKGDVGANDWILAHCNFVALIQRIFNSDEIQYAYRTPDEVLNFFDSDFFSFTEIWYVEEQVKWP